MTTRTPRGFATLIAVAMLGLVAAAIVVFTTHLRFAVMRTRLVSQDAELRELLLAGAQEAVDRAGRWAQDAPREYWQVELPRDLSSQGAAISLHSDVAGADEATIQVDARLGARKSGQTLRFRRTGGRWNVTGAALAGDESPAI